MLPQGRTPAGHVTIYFFSDPNPFLDHSIQQNANPVRREVLNRLSRHRKHLFHVADLAYKPINEILTVPKCGHPGQSIRPLTVDKINGREK